MVAVFLCKNPTAQPWDITVKTSKSKGRDFGSPREVSYDFLTSKIKQPISRLQSYGIPAWKKIERLRLTFIGSLSSDVFERRTSTGSEVFSLLTCLDDIKLVFLSFFTFIEAI